MQPNPILTEIRHTRDEMARAAGYDVKKFMDTICAHGRTAAAKGTVFARLVLGEEESCIFREEPSER